MRLEDMQWVTKVELELNPLIQLEAGKSSIKYFFNDLSDETKSFIYQ